MVESDVLWIKIKQKREGDGGSIKLEKLPNYICSDPQDSHFFNGLQSSCL